MCGDFKVTDNRSQTYPLPTPEEMFSTLVNGESYSKLDLAKSYKQMRVSAASQPLLMVNTHLGRFNMPGFHLEFPWPRLCGKR